MKPHTILITLPSVCFLHPLKKITIRWFCWTSLIWNIKELEIRQRDHTCVVDSYDKSICRLFNTGYGPESKENLVKMICSLPSWVLAFPGGIFHPEMFCVGVRSNSNYRFTKNFWCLSSILCCFPGHPKSESNSK